ncbi:MAG: hypothetical protein A2583_15440 [Bdellovibrionales bacterium RIFOXYD1_FULL_53_11]|nr:MAG: hypothetical protein A2583_15440 [Bdellovibrionales bacterium RIFOXYD1_FULL_53_11]
MINFFLTEAYSQCLSEIEDHIFTTTANLEHVIRFVDEHDRVLTFIAHNPKTSATHPVTGDQSWVFGDGRYRIFFKLVPHSAEDTTVYLTHIIDNRQANLEVYPNNTMPTYQQHHE